jgi:hypothetical protein
MLAIDPMVSSTPASISSDDLQHLKGAANIQTLACFFFCPNYPGAFGVFGFLMGKSNSWAHNFVNETAS